MELFAATVTHAPTTMQHMAFIMSQGGDVVFRDFTADKELFQKPGRKYSFRAKLEARRQNLALVRDTQNTKLLFCVTVEDDGGSDASPHQHLTLTVPDFMFPLESIEVWNTRDKLNDQPKPYSPAAIENMNGMLSAQYMSEEAKNASLSVPRRRCVVCLLLLMFLSKQALFV